MAAYPLSSCMNWQIIPSIKMYIHPAQDGALDIRTYDDVSLQDVGAVEIPRGSKVKVTHIATDSERASVTAHYDNHVTALFDVTLEADEAAMHATEVAYDQPPQWEWLGPNVYNITTTFVYFEGV